jgi:hypothetical protein
MSRAFVNEDAGYEPEPTYHLPDRDSPYYDQAAARALLEGANVGNSKSAERATGYRWGERRLVPHIRALLQEATSRDDARQAQLARRFLRAADVDGG